MISNVFQGRTFRLKASLADLANGGVQYRAFDILQSRAQISTSHALSSRSAKGPERRTISLLKQYYMYTVP